MGTSFGDGEKSCWGSDDGLRRYFTDDGTPDKIDIVDKMLEFIGEVEEAMDCSSACAKPLFGVTRSLADGPVEAECVDRLIDTLDTLVAPAIVCLLTFFILLFSCIGGCWLCCGNNKHEGSDDMMNSQYAGRGGVQMGNGGMVMITQPKTNQM